MTPREANYRWTGFRVEVDSFAFRGDKYDPEYRRVYYLTMFHRIGDCEVPWYFDSTMEFDPVARVRITGDGVTVDFEWNPTHD